MNRTPEMKPAVNRNAPREAPSSPSVSSLQYQLSGGRNNETVPVNLTRANMDQWKRNLKLQIQQKTQKLNSLHSEVNSLLSGMQDSIDAVTADLQSRKGRPDQLASWLLQEFNNRGKAVQQLDTEICKSVKQVQELRSKLTAVTKRIKTDPGALKAGHRKPNEPCTVEEPKSPARQPSMMGFPVSQNQFQSLSVNEAQESEFSPVQSLEDPRKTRAQRLQASSSGEGHGTLQGNDAVNDSPPVLENEPTFFNSLSVSAPDILRVQSGGPVQYSLGTGAIGDDAMYNMYVKDVACTESSCNKRISYAGQEWSAGRPGNRPTGASEAARNTETCLGPYATRETVQPHAGCNTREEQASSRPRQEVQDQCTSQQATASSSRRNAAEDRASPAKVALQPRRPPYYSGGLDEDVHTWTSIVTRWLDIIQGEPTAQLTFIVSLLRGAAYDWYRHYETRTGCPGDWTTLRLALLQRFGTSIRAEKARAGLYQLKQDKMTVLQYADAFESRLAQIENYDESYYLIHFIFGLRPEIMRGVYLQQPASILAAKEMAEKLELTHQCTASHQTHTKTKKTNKATRQRGTQERRSGSWRKSDAVQLKACQSQKQRQTSDSFRERALRIRSSRST